MNYIINLNEKILAVYSTKKNACIYILNYYIEKLNDSKTKKIENINKKKQLDRKKEKENEIARRFDTDYNIYLKIKDNNDIPILFEVQFNIFKNMENDNILNDIKKSFQIYKENFNKIKENVGSSKYSSLFNKNEYEAI